MGALGAPLTIWTVSDGRIGIDRQAVSLASAISHAETERGGPAPFVRSLHLNPGGWRTFLPPHLWPAPEQALPADQRVLLSPPWPDIWIASGRRSIAYSHRIRTRAGRGTLVVQTQDPRGPLGAFDLVIPPEHDRLKGQNVFPILGSPTHFSLAQVEDAAVRFPELVRAQGPRILMAIGGNSKTHRLPPRLALGIEAGVRRLSGLGATLWITVSRRTPGRVADSLRTLARDVGARFWQAEAQDGPNPYLGFLAFCDAALITEDSANMISDAAFFAKPIHLIRLAGSSPRFDRLHQGFIDRGAARWFTGSVSHWTYTPIREAGRAAEEILKRYEARLASSSKSGLDAGT